MNNKPFAPSCERNQPYIFQALAPLLANFEQPQVLEIGSGTGQHAVYFAQQLSKLLWQPSELAENLAGISAWREEAGLNNVLAPLELNVENQWPKQIFDAIYTANTLHIMSKAQVELFFQGLKQVTKSGSLLLVYGPFNRNGQFTSQSNAEFELWLKSRNPLSGIRDIEWIQQLAAEQGFAEFNEHIMPANNLLLSWKKL